MGSDDVDWVLGNLSLKCSFKPTPERQEEACWQEHASIGPPKRLEAKGG